LEVVVHTEQAAGRTAAAAVEAGGTEEAAEAEVDRRQTVFGL
jgi:hypothetical protein